MSLAAECLAAQTGLWPKKTEPSEHDRLAASGMLDRWRSKLSKWLRHPEQVKPFEWTDPPDQADLREKIMRPIDLDEEERLIAMTGDVDLGREYVAVLRAGREYLNNRWPKIQVPGLTLEMYPPSVEELASVWNATRVLDEADALMDEIEAYSVSVTMINAWKHVFPSLAAEVSEMLDGVDGLLIELDADGHKLTWQQEDIIKKLVGKPRDQVPQTTENQKQEKPKPAASVPTKAIEHATRGDFKP